MEVLRGALSGVAIEGLVLGVFLNLTMADWISLRMMLAAVALVGVIALFLGDCWGRWRIVRTDLPRSGALCPPDARAGNSPRPGADVAGNGSRGTTPAHVLHFENGYTSTRPTLEDRWRRLELEGLAMSPFDLDGHRRENLR